MLQIRVLNHLLDRNEPTFRPLQFIHSRLRDYSIELTTSRDCDYTLVGMHDFIDKSVPLQESVDRGLNNLSMIDGEYILVDGSDSTSLLGGYEVLEQSDALCLLKNQKFYTREEYKTPYSLGKWFFGEDDENGFSYDISEDMWSRIKFSGYNLGWLLPHYHDYEPILSGNQKTNDVCAIFQADHKKNYEHGIQNDTYYNNHRQGLWKVLEPLKSKYKMLTTKMDYPDYVRELCKSKITISPFGMGELCFRDFEAMKFGTVLIKPSHRKIDTIPNVMIDDDTFIACEHDWSDLEEKIDYVLSNYDEVSDQLLNNMRNKYTEEYNVDRLCKHWYDMFSDIIGAA